MKSNEQYAIFSSKDKNMIEKKIELLKKQMAKIDTKDFDLEAWKSSTIVILGSIFGDDSQKIRQIENIKYKSSGFATASASHSWDNMDSCKKRGKEILDACITELENFGLHEKIDKKSGGFGIIAGGNVTIRDVSGQVALGDTIVQTQSIGRADLEELRKSLTDFQNGIAKIGLSAEDQNIVEGDISAAIKEAKKDKPLLSRIKEKFESTINTIKEAGKTIEDLSELYEPAKKIAKLVGIGLSVLLFQKG